MELNHLFKFRKPEPESISSGKLVPPEGIEPSLSSSKPDVASLRGGMELKERIELSFPPYQGGVLPVNYSSMWRP